LLTPFGREGWRGLQSPNRSGAPRQRSQGSTIWMWPLHQTFGLVLPLASSSAAQPLPFHVRAPPSSAPLCLRDCRRAAPDLGGALSTSNTRLECFAVGLRAAALGGGRLAAGRCRTCSFRFEARQLRFKVLHGGARQKQLVQSVGLCALCER